MVTKAWTQLEHAVFKRSSALCESAKKLPKTYSLQFSAQFS
jgi:hypothetical protein